MHTLRCRPAGRVLESYVRAYAQREIDIPGKTIIEAVPARLEQTLEFQFGEHFTVLHPSGQQRATCPATLIGTHTQGGWTIALCGRIISFAVFFQPTGFSRLFGVPMVELLNTARNAKDVLGRPIVRLQEQMAARVSFDERVEIAEKFLLDRAARSAPTDSMAEAAAYIFASHGGGRISEIAGHHGLGLRHFQRKFQHYVGVGPKLFARVARFQHALDAKIAAPQRTWLHIAHDLGYHDQMHLVRDFHDLAGDAPGSIISSIGDIRPPAMGLHRRF
jgi:AraC-like DNA-binding protein